MLYLEFPRFCASTAVPNSNFNSSCSIVGRASDSITISCSDGYYASGGNEAVCQSDGIFSVPECLNSCPTPRQYGYVFASGATEIGASRSSRCATGFIGNASEIICFENNTWSLSFGCLPILSDCSGQYATATTVRPGNIEDCNGACQETKNGLVCQCAYGFRASAESYPCEPDLN